MRATGMPDGEYTLGGQAVQVRGNRATLVEGGALAGSVTNLADCVRVAVKEMQIPLESAVAAATMNPAKSVGLYDKYGSITEGKVGNVVLLREDLSLKAVRFLTYASEGLQSKVLDDYIFFLKDLL